MNIIIGQNESLPNIKGNFVIPRFSTGSVVIIGDNKVFTTEVDTVRDSSLSYSGNTQKTKVVFDASEDGTKKVWKDNAKVTTKNFTYKIWYRKF